MITVIDGFTTFKDLPTTELEITWVDYEDNSKAAGTFRRAEFNPLTGQQISVIQEPITTTDVFNYRDWLNGEKARVQALLADYNAFIDMAQANIAQWLIDNPPPTPATGATANP